MLPVLFAPEAAPSDYDYGFSENIEPWNSVRWRIGSSHLLDHEIGCEGGACGLLRLYVNQSSAYALASPVVKGPQRPYTINFQANLKDKKDKQQYGVVFGGNHTAGQECPLPDFSSCFSNYYEFRVRYRDTNGEQYVEYRLRKIDSHDSANQPVSSEPDLIEWTRADVTDIDQYIKWTINYRESGHISVKANNREQAGYGRDSEYGDNLYFGVLARSVEQGQVTALFDSFKITADSSQ